METQAVGKGVLLPGIEMTRGITAKWECYDLTLLMTRQLKSKLNRAGARRDEQAEDGMHVS